MNEDSDDNQEGCHEKNQQEGRNQVERALGNRVGLVVGRPPDNIQHGAINIRILDGVGGDCRVTRQESELRLSSLRSLHGVRELFVAQAWNRDHQQFALMALNQLFGERPRNDLGRVFPLVRGFEDLLPV